MYQLKYKIWLENEGETLGKVFGKGPYELLKGVKKFGSLSEAAKSIKMSYNKAFNLIKDIEKRLGYSLVKAKTGGSGGGGSQLTEEGEKLMATYEAFVKESDQELQKVFRKYFG